MSAKLRIDRTRNYLHGYHIVVSEVEAGSQVLQTLHDWLREYRFVFL